MVIKAEVADEIISGENSMMRRQPTTNLKLHFAGKAEAVFMTNR